MIITKKIFKDLGKEKTFVFVMLMQLVLIASITLILTFTAVFFSPESLIANNLRIATVNVDDELFVQDSKLTLFDYSDEEYYIERGIIDIQENKIDSLIILEQKNPHIFTIYLPESDLQSSLILAYLKERFEILENKILNQYVDVIDIETINVVGRRNKGSDYIFEIIYGFLIPFLFLVPIFLVGSLIIDIITQEIESKTILILNSAISLKRYFNEVILASFFMSFIQIIIWLSLIQLRGIKVNNFMPLIIYLALISLLISLCAIIIATKFKTKAKAQLIYSVLIMIISTTIGLSYLNPVAFISIIVTGIEQISIIGYLIVGILILILYSYLIKTDSTKIIN